MKHPPTPYRLVLEPRRFPQIEFTSASQFETKPQHINIGYCGPTGEHEAMAQFMVKACNSHDALVSLLKRTSDHLSGYPDPTLHADICAVLAEL